MIRQRFFIDSIFPSANDVVSAHYRTYARLKKDYEILARAAIRRGHVKRMEWARVIFTWHEKPAQKKQRRDPDNIRFGAKFILDALTHEQILEDDSIGFVVGLQDSFVVESKTPGVWVELEGELLR